MENEQGNELLRRLDEQEHRQQVRTLLREHYGISGEVVRAAELANVLGMTAQTIRRGMQRGDFFLPCVRILAGTFVKIEDLTRWMCERPATPCFGAKNAIDIEKQAAARLNQQALDNMRKRLAESQKGLTR